MFVLVKTSNPSSAEIQDLAASSRPIHEHVADLVERWGASCRGLSGYSAVGAVVGATFPEAAARLRATMPHSIMLLPGYGAQGAAADDCRFAFDEDGRGAIVNSSRGITGAFKENSPWERAIADAAGTMRAELEAVRLRAPTAT